VPPAPQACPGGACACAALNHTQLGAARASHEFRTDTLHCRKPRHLCAVKAISFAAIAARSCGQSKKVNSELSKAALGSEGCLASKEVGGGVPLAYICPGHCNRQALPGCCAAPSITVLCEVACLAQSLQRCQAARVCLQAGMEERQSI
jgi:hypothetical protein